MGKSKDKSVGKDADIGKTIIAVLLGSKDGKSMDIKSLRKSVLLSAQIVADASDDIDKSSKKLFKEAVKSLESSGSLTLSAEGVVKLSKAERKNASGKESIEKAKKKKEKKRKREKDNKGDDEKDEEAEGVGEQEGDDTTEKKKPKSESHDGSAENSTTHAVDSAEDGVDAEEQNPADKNKSCKGNKEGITRLFVGNLPFTVDEATLKTHLLDAVTHIKWITDKETGKFYGSAFVEMRNSRDSAKVVSEVDGSKLMGRPVKINFAPSREGDQWPPRSSVITGGKKAGGQAGGSGVKAMGVKPEDCKKLFIGNLSFDIDDDAIAKFFMTVEAELKEARWLHHKDTGDFKGCGYAEFWNTAACDKAASLNGKDLLGRPIRIDWTE